ncbi:MAG: thermonuclease family protein [Chromatiales bacterium]
MPINTVSKFLQKALLSLLFGSLLSDQAWSASLTGQVFSVQSGDQITLSTSSNQFHKIKLLGIESPQVNTYQGRLSQKYLQMLLAGKFVTIVYHSLTPQGTILGQVLHGGVDMNQRMIEAGRARFITQRGMDQHMIDTYVASQESSQRKGVGMWGKNH